MLVCVDVDYRERSAGTNAVAAAVVFGDWSTPEATGEYLRHIETVAPYVPGKFYTRELPCVLAVLSQVREPLDTVIIDGHVYLDSEHKPGLGAYVYDALEQRIPVIGVAKNRFRDETHAIELLRGDSQRPLFVTAAGMEPERAAAEIARMHGAHRMPTLLKRVDRLCREAWSDLSAT